MSSVLFRGLILEGVACSGKSTLLRALLAHPSFVHRAGPSAVVLTEHHTQRVLESLASRNTLTVHDNLNLLREHTNYLRGIVSRLAAMSHWNDPARANVNPRTVAVIERFHLSHVLNYEHLAWSDVADLDADLAALGLTLCIVSAHPDEIRRRIHTRGPDWGAFLQQTVQRNHLRDSCTSDAVADYFIRQQDQLLELAARSRLLSAKIDTTAVQPSEAAENLLVTALGLPTSAKASSLPTL